MVNFDNSLEHWLTAERQQMSRPKALTTFLTDKAAMLSAVSFDPSDNRNLGAAKARSHIQQCERLITVAGLDGLDEINRCKQLGILASKSLKVASGFSMRAGYFHPDSPEGTIYRDRMIGLVDASGNRLPVLGMRPSELSKLALSDAKFEAPRSTTDPDPTLLLEAGKEAASQADKDLQELLLDEIERDPKFSGSVETQHAADKLTDVTKGIFVALGISALKLQNDGPGGLGPIILEPRSDADANFYLRIESLEPTVIDQVTHVSSQDMITR